MYALFSGLHMERRKKKVNKKRQAQNMITKRYLLMQRGTVR